MVEGEISNKDMLVYHNEGMTLKHIGTIAGMSAQSVKWRLDKLENEMINYMSEGYTGREAAAIIGCRPHRITKYVEYINKKYN